MAKDKVYNVALSLNPLIDAGVSVYKDGDTHMLMIRGFSPQAVDEMITYLSFNLAQYQMVLRDNYPELGEFDYLLPDEPETPKDEEDLPDVLRLR